MCVCARVCIDVVHMEDAVDKVIVIQAAIDVKSVF